MSVTALPKSLVQLTQATFVNGHWRKAAVSARQVNALRKEAVLAGKVFELPLPPVRMVIPTEKGHKHQREKQARLVDIANKMKAMPKQVDEHRTSARQARRLAKLGRMLVAPFPV